MKNLLSLVHVQRLLLQQIIVIPKPQLFWKVKEKSEVRPVMWRLHHSSPAWKLKVCIEAMKARPIDLTTLAQETGVQFASAELVETAANCLDEITKKWRRMSRRTQVLLHRL